MDEMTNGYIDGSDPETPPPSDNRSHAYRHGFANARDDLKGEPRATAETLRAMAQDAKTRDDGFQI